MKQIIDFLTELKENNNRDWFLANKKRYDKLKKEYQDFIQELIAEISKFDADFANLNAKDCLFRINRDVRFSNDKSPYKTNFGASICKRGKKDSGPLFYVHLEPNSSFIAAGVYMPDAEFLKKIRQEIDYNLDEFRSIINHSTFQKYFKGLDQESALKSSPKGYEKDQDGIEFLRLRSFTVTNSLSDKDLVSKDLIKEIKSGFEAAKAFNDFLDKARD